MKKRERPEKSLQIAIEQIAQLLRSQVKATQSPLKLENRHITSHSSSMSNTIEQIALLIRRQIQSSSSPKKKSRKSPIRARSSRRSSIKKTLA